jgi:hypothetical protein
MVLFYENIKASALYGAPNTVLAYSTIPCPEEVLTVLVLKCLGDIELIMVLFDITPHQVAG